MKYKLPENQQGLIELPDYRLLLENIKQDWQCASISLDTVQTNYGFIPTIRHQAQIKPLADIFYQRTGIEAICFCLIVGNLKYLISNCPRLAVPFRLYQIPLIEPRCNPQVYQFQDHIYDATSKADTTSRLITSSIEEIFNVHHSYLLVREAIECTLVITCGGDRPHENPGLLYQQTRIETQNFAIQFFNELDELLAEQAPWLKSLRFFNDPAFRKQVIMGRYNRANMLSQQQLNTLVWASMGKTAKEIAILMELSVHTVREYLQECIERLDAVNLTHAVARAKDRKLI